jgi:hypothetical protein
LLTSTLPAVQLRFSRLFGFYGKHRYSITIWQHLTLCYQRIQRQGAAQKCLEKTLMELERVMKEGLGNVQGENQEEIVSISEDEPLK